MINPTFDMLNQRGTPMFFSDVFANRPPAAIVGRIFVSTDTFELYRDTGTTWDLLSGPGTGTITGSGTAFKYPVFTASGVIGNGTIEQFTTENISTRNFSIDTSANAISDEAKLDLTITFNSQIESALFEFSQNGEGPPTLQITNTLDATFLSIGNSELYLANANQRILYEQNGATGLTINNSTSGITANTFIKLQTLNSTTYGEIAKLSALFTTYKILVGNDLAIFNSSESGDIGILNDFATGSIKFAAGGSSTAHLTIASTGATTFTNNMTISRNQNSATRILINNTTVGTGAASNLTITASNGTFQIGKYSSSTTAYKTLLPNDSYIYNDLVGDISILNDLNTGRIKFATGSSSTAQMTLANTGNLLLGSVTDLGKRLQVTGDTTLIGSGSTGGTSALQVVNSASQLLFELRNDRTILFSDSSLLVFTSSNASLTIETSQNRNLILLANTRQNAANNSAPFQIEGNFIPLVGNNILQNFIIINPSINQSSGANGITRGIYINPTLTSAADWRGIEISSGGVYVNTTSVSAGAILQADSTTKGFLPPRMTSLQRNSIGTLVAGLIVYDTTLNKLYVYTNAWEQITSI
jgi:hypothetical protein